jgi:hypothetical protein
MQDDNWSMPEHAQSHSNHPEMNDAYYAPYPSYPSVLHSNAM